VQLLPDRFQRRAKICACKSNRRKRRWTIGSLVANCINDFCMNPFEQKLSGHGLNLRRARLQTLQINLGRQCNQSCRHCHVDAAPWRTEMMSAPVAERVGE